MSNIYGYVRVSSIDQNEDRQMFEMGKKSVMTYRSLCKRITYQSFRLDKKGL